MSQEKNLLSDFVTNELELEILGKQKVMNKFSDEIKKSAAWALEWGEGNLRVAASLRVSQIIVCMIREGVDLDGLLLVARQEIVRVAIPLFSEVSIASVMDQCFHASWTEMLKRLENLQEQV